MKYFNYLSESDKNELFYIKPQEITKDNNVKKLSYGIGPVLYMPATRETIADELIHKRHPSLMSSIFCLEDSIGDEEVIHAEEMLMRHINKIVDYVESNNIHEDDIPFLFIRIRDCEQFSKIAEKIGHKLKIITGFVFPKFTQSNGMAYLNILLETNKKYNVKLYGMPILETSDIMYKESRIEALSEIYKLLTLYKDYILNIRVGAEDFLSLYGIRRNNEVSIYDIGVARDCIADILNIFTRNENHFVVSGPVWEYFDDNKGLIREIKYDKINGIIGKTIIHPSNLIPAQIMHIISHEDYEDAKSILANNNSQIGVMKSSYGNRMNEIKPHYNWAKRIVMLSEIYGVMNKNENYETAITRITDNR